MESPSEETPMTGEYCGTGCGYCGRCDAAEPEDFCPFCDTYGCDGTCPEYYTEMDGAFNDAEASDDTTDPTFPEAA
jgi:hypothetical protein